MKTIFRIGFVAVLLLASEMSLAQAKRDDDKTMTQVQSQGRGGPHKSYLDPNRPAQLLNDGQALAILKTFHHAETDMANLGRKKGQALSLKSFSVQMDKDHGDLRHELSNFEKKTKLTAEDNSVSQELQKMKDQNKANLEKLSGKDFDLAFLQYEVKAHEKILQIIDTDLLPRVRNPELKALVAKARIEMEEHLQRAGYTLTTLNNPGL